MRSNPVVPPQIEGDLLQMKWGSVLRSMQPSETNAAAGQSEWRSGQAGGGGSTLLGGQLSARGGMSMAKECGNLASPRYGGGGTGQTFLRPPVGYPAESPRQLRPPIPILSARPQLV